VKLPADWYSARSLSAPRVVSRKAENDPAIVYARRPASVENPAPTTGAVDRLYAATRLYTDGSHWRIRNITAGYTFSPRFANRIGMQSVRLYGTAQDPYIHTDYIGIDPEVRGGVPTVRTLLIGSNFVF